jgi:hypothetical protein
LEQRDPSVPLYLGVNLLAPATWKSATAQTRDRAVHSTGFYCLSRALADRLYAEEMADGKFQKHCAGLIAPGAGMTDDLKITELIDKKMGVHMRWPDDYLLGMHMQVPW